MRRVENEKGEINRVNIRYYRHVWEGDEENRNRQGWKNGRRKH